jgi:hypothetical protein
MPDEDTAAPATGGATETSASATTQDVPPGESSSGGTPDPTASTGPDDGSTSDDPTPSLCTDATLLAGNPYFEGRFDGWNPDGQGLFADPPLRSRHLAALSDHVAIETQREVWITDEAHVRRIAGDEHEESPQYRPLGACADVRVIIGNGIAALPNGNLVYADSLGNGLIELADPLGDCTASAIAGNQEAILEVDIDDDVANPGDVDGPGVDAMFYAPENPVADGDGNVYVFDVGNSKLKRIANDADRTVTTIYEHSGAEEPLAMTVLDGIVYVSLAANIDDLLVAVDPESGDVEELFRGRGLFAELDSSQIATMFGMANDGVDLLIASNKGYVFRVTKQGESLGAVAGMGPIVDFPNVDVTMPLALDELPLSSYTTKGADLVRFGDDFLFTGAASGIGFHIWAIHC